MAEVDWRKHPAIPRLPACGRCFGHGAFKSPHTKRYHLCICGRRPNASIAYKLAKQEKLDARLREIKTKGW
jgi:hypothetical protein